MTPTLRDTDRRAPSATRGARTSGMLLLLGSLLPGAAAADVLVPEGSSWRYLDDGSDQGTAWVAPGFDDSSWSVGPAPLGYGDGDEATVVSFGPNPGSKYITTWFRHAFTVADPSGYTTAVARIQRDDGAIVYLNGVEIARQNMPAGPVGFTTVASSTVADAKESNFFTTTFDPALLAAGTNTLAVEVHQRSGGSSDVSFDLQLVASDQPIVIRGPYLQRLSDTEVVLRWRTNLDGDARVWIGPEPGALSPWVDDPTVTQLHEVTVSGLSPDTTFHYAVGTTSGPPIAGDDDEHVVRTAPPPGTARPLRIWALGDAGTANQDARAVRDAYADLVGPAETDVMLLLGDNAYDDGLTAEYQAALFDMYPQWLRRTAVWPARGNHDTNAGAYLALFTLPSAAEAGGVPSGTELYYSFDHGNVHFLCLDSFSSSLVPGAPMALWVEADLMATTQDWIIAFWHHPPYSKGSHDSDTEAQLQLMRTTYVPLFESYGVDVVLCGHSHSYERTFLIDGFVGLSSTWDPLLHQVDGGDGDPLGGGAYEKVSGPNEGAVYVVAGSSGKITSASLGHPAMAHEEITLGSVVLDVYEDVLNARFLTAAGAVSDVFTIDKSPEDAWTYRGGSLDGERGQPWLRAGGPLTAGSPTTLDVANARPAASAALVIGLGALAAPFKGGVLVPSPDLVVLGAVTDASGELALTDTWPAGVPAGASVLVQFWIDDPAGPVGWSATNAVEGLAP